MPATLVTDPPFALVSEPMTGKDAAKLILQGRAPQGLIVKGSLEFHGDERLTELPAELTADRLDVSGCKNLRRLPDGLRVTWLKADGCTALTELPANLACYEADLKDTPLRSVPFDLRVEYRLDLSGCAELRELPDGLKVGSLTLQGCSQLQSLPEGLDVFLLDVSGCARLKTWPQRASAQIVRVRARGCVALTDLPAWMANLSQLDLRGCSSLASLPETLSVSSWIDLADTAIMALPPSLSSANLRWRGVPVNARVVFEPESITAAEVLATNNAELRRVLLERMGYEAFMLQANAQTLDTDQDPGGERRLLRVPLKGDEDIVCVSVFCPSTGRQYIIRVPPKTCTCRQAAAWIAGYENENDYRPIAET